jgi:hypothetical protein
MALPYSIFQTLLSHNQAIIWALSQGKPRGLDEKYIKSFCSLWDAKLLKSMQLQFMMDERNPSYQTQDMLLAKGYKIETISPHRLFKFLDHVQAGTKSLCKGYGHKHRNIQRQLDHN